MSCPARLRVKDEQSGAGGRSPRGADKAASAAAYAEGAHKARRGHGERQPERGQRVGGANIGVQKRAALLGWHGSQGGLKISSRAVVLAGGKKRRSA